MSDIEAVGMDHAIRELVDAGLGYEGPITIPDLQAAGASRSARWHDGSTRPWSLLEWAGAMCGEAGEAANVAKKILRIDLGTGGNEAAEHAITDRGELVKKLAGELAGTILYAERVATEAGIDLEEAIVRTFNQKSIALGFPDRLGLPGSIAGQSDPTGGATPRVGLEPTTTRLTGNGPFGSVGLEHPEGNDLDGKTERVNPASAGLPEAPGSNRGQSVEAALPDDRANEFWEGR